MMESFLEALGWLGLFILVAVGALAGYVASLVSGGRNRGKYIALGVIAALATPILLALIGVGVVAASGIAAIIVAALVGAVVVLLIARAVFD
jgi:uncharacterized membrane protein YeaQ/YmgE (transglycosylase-associated protein family)